MKNRKILLVLALLTIVFVFFILSFINNRGFRLISSTPSLSRDVSTISSVIRLDFNDQIKDGNYINQLSGDDADIVDLVRVDDLSIFLYLKSLDEKKYSLSISNVTSVNDNVIDLINLDFSSKYIPFSELSKEQQDLENSIDSIGNVSDPILDHFPHREDNIYMYIEYIDNDTGHEGHLSSKNIVVRGDVYISPEEKLEDRGQLMIKYEEKMKNYIRSVEINPDEYSIYYELY